MCDDPEHPRNDKVKRAEPETEGVQLKSPVYEMFWDCEYCGTSELLGKTHRHCPACGALQDSDRRYFPPESKRVAVQDHVYFGADRVCRACENPNSANARFCGACGAELDDADLAIKKEPAEAGEEPGKKSATSRSRVPVVLLALVSIGVALAAWNYYFTTAIEVEVAGHSWRRRVVIERYGLVSRSAWCDSLPSGARVVRRSREVRSTRKVMEGEICNTVKIDNRDGTFRSEENCQPKYRSVRVYDQRCFYQALDWEVEGARELAEEGTNARWPTTGILPCSELRSGCRREGKRAEQYYLKVNFQGASEDCRVPLDLWRSVSVKERLRAELSGISSALRCTSLSRYAKP